MARKTAEIVIDADNRDRGKKFLLTEMGSSRAEDWAARALCGVLGAVDIPNAPDPSEGMAGLARVVGDVKVTGLDWAKLRPLSDDLLGCVEIVTEAGPRMRLTPATVDAYVEEPTTLMRLRMEVLALHVGFSADAVRSTLAGLFQTASSNIKTVLG